MGRTFVASLAILLAAASTCDRRNDVGVESPVETRRQATPITPSVEARAVVESADRTAEDRETDARRRPAELLTFMDVKSGMKVADLAAGGGYTTELLVRAVGEEGIVYAQNNAHTLEKFVKDSWPQRLARPVNQRVVRLDREFEDPFPPTLAGLDLVTIVFSYHDVVAQGGDVNQLNTKVFAVLRPGGHYVVLDHSAPAGTGTQTTEDLHRIDDKAVVGQIVAAGFELAESSDFLRDPSDGLDTQVWTVGFVTDRFALKFVKPAG